MLLVASGGGNAVHLAALSPDAPARAAIPDHGFEYDQSSLLTYDEALLRERRWATETLCGRSWATMVGGDGGPIGWSDESAFAPTCRKCLAAMDKRFTPPTLDARLDLVAQVAADAVTEHRGYAEVHGVPGDQQAALRKAIRGRVRERTGYGVRTYVLNAAIFVECRTLVDEHADESMAEAAEALQSMFSGEGGQPPPNPEWRIFWSTWDLG